MTRCSICSDGSTPFVCEGCKEQARRLQWTLSTLDIQARAQSYTGRDIFLARALEVGLLDVEEEL